MRDERSRRFQKSVLYREMSSSHHPGPGVQQRKAPRKNAALRALAHAHTHTLTCDVVGEALHEGGEANGNEQLRHFAQKGDEEVRGQGDFDNGDGWVHVLVVTPHQPVCE